MAVFFAFLDFKMAAILFDRFSKTPFSQTMCRTHNLNSLAPKL